jgi:hypothetical protein
MVGKWRCCDCFITKETFGGGPGKTMKAFVYNFLEVKVNQSWSPPLEVSTYWATSDSCSKPGAGDGAGEGDMEVVDDISRRCPMPSFSLNALSTL